MGMGDHVITNKPKAEANAARRSRRRRLRARLGTDRLFYGWWMVMSGAVSNFFIVGVVFYGIGVLYEPMRRDLGWSMAALTAGASVRSFEQGFMAPIMGYLTDRFGPRLMALIGISLMAGGLVLLSQVHTLWTYYASAAITSLGFSLGGLLPY